MVEKQQIHIKPQLRRGDIMVIQQNASLGKPQRGDIMVDRQIKIAIKPQRGDIMVIKH